METKELAPFLFCLHFKHEFNVAGVMNDGTWPFQQKLIVLNRFSLGSNPLAVPIWGMELWVHILDLQACFWTEKMAITIGKYIGSFVKTDQRPLDGAWRAYLKIRVLVDIRKPLKAKMRLKKPGGEWNVIRFQYERLPNFCFFVVLSDTRKNFANQDLMLEMMVRS